jgi:hypothetical protein
MADNEVAAIEFFRITNRTDHNLLKWVIEHAGERQPGRRARWSYVGELFGLGSGTSMLLCRRFGLDPDHEPETSEPPDCADHCDVWTETAEQEFLEKAAKECDCCERCADVPCPGVTAGGVCDGLCNCEEGSDGME